MKALVLCIGFLLMSNMAQAKYVVCAKTQEVISPFWKTFEPTKEEKQAYRKACKEQTGSAKIQIKCVKEACGRN